MPYPKNKYRKGYTIFAMNELLWRHLKQGRWVYLRNKVVHPSFILHMTLNTVAGLLEAHQISEAIDQQKEYYSDVKVKPYATLSRD